MYYVAVHALSANRYLSSMRLTWNRMAFSGIFGVDAPRCFARIKISSFGERLGGINPGYPTKLSDY